MQNPFKYRPQDPAIGDDTEPDFWEDNWLSNFMAAASQVVTPNWCETEEHWTSKVTEYLFTTCPCCLIWRGLFLGFISGSLITTLVSWVIFR